MYNFAPKTKTFVPYEPDTGSYRIRLDANESFLLPTEADRERMAEAALKLPLNRYPDPLAREVCAAWAALYGVDPAHVTAGNGSDELISLIMSAFLQRGEKVLTVAPDFSMYRFYTAITENSCITLDKPELQIDVDEVIETIKRENIRLFIFSNPCNPTSLGLTRKEVRRIITGTDALIVLDEAYMDFWDQSLLSEVTNYDNLIVLRTCSKALGLASLRLGFAAANDKITSVLRAAKSPYNVNAVTQAMAAVVLKNPMYYEVYPGLIIESRRQLQAGFRQLAAEGVVDKVYESCTNFILAEANNADALDVILKGQGIAVRRFGDFLRVTAGTQRENEAVLAVLGGKCNCQ